MRPTRIAPSLLAADYSRLGDEVARVEKEVDMLHLDIMDGHFVPNIFMGTGVVAALRPLTNLEFDCHLMTTNPGAHVPHLAEAGADVVTIHIEAVTDPTSIMAMADAHGLKFGLVLNPGTPFDAVAPFADRCDMILVMSVEPGLGGQRFIPEVLGKVETAREWVESRGLAVDIQIDGGITPQTARAAADAGANVFVAGTAVFGADDPASAIAELREAIK
jgi:ribulose-phosphate 3-epimerase